MLGWIIFAQMSPVALATHVLFCSNDLLEHGSLWLWGDSVRVIGNDFYLSEHSLPGSQPQREALYQQTHSEGVPRSSLYVLSSQAQPQHHI